jgi:cysteine-rich repeat protein
MKHLNILNASWTVGLMLLAGCSVDGVELGSGRDLVEVSRGGTTVDTDHSSKTSSPAVSSVPAQTVRPLVSQAIPDGSGTLDEVPNPSASDNLAAPSGIVPPVLPSNSGTPVLPSNSGAPDSAPLVGDACGGSIPYLLLPDSSDAGSAPYGSIVVPDAEWKGGTYEFALPPTCGVGPDAVSYPAGYIVCPDYVGCASSSFSSPEKCLTILRECYLSNDKEICGNGVVQGAEACDDGNNISDDGCDRGCRFVETGYQCPEAGQACFGIPEVCGNGQIQGEACDDGNRNSDDGCRADCQAVEPGYECPVVGQPCVLVEN